MFNATGLPSRVVPTWRGLDPLAWLVAPGGIDGFLRDHWEQKSLIIRRAEPGYYNDLLTFDDVNAFMARNDIRYPYLRLVKNGRELPLVDYADDFVYGSNVFPGLLDNDKVFHHYADGATLSFQIFQKCMQELSDFCNALEARLRFQTQVNIFVTPPESKGFTAHYDDHSFFILQVSGEKHWTLYGNPVELPLQEFRRGTKTPDLGAGEEVVLRAGDLLYLPKGFYHEARTTDATSVHITLGIFPFTWLQILERALSSLKQDLEWRRAPSDYLQGEGWQSRLDERFQALVAQLASARGSDALLSLFDDAASKQIVDGRNRLRDLGLVRFLAPQTRLCRRDVLCRIVPANDRVRVSFYDKSISFPQSAANALSFILGVRSTFRVSELPGPLDEASNVAVVRKLVREGLLTIEA